MVVTEAWAGRGKLEVGDGDLTRREVLYEKDFRGSGASICVYHCHAGHDCHGRNGYRRVHQSPFAEFIDR